MVNRMPTPEDELRNAPPGVLDIGAAVFGSEGDGQVRIAFGEVPREVVVDAEDALRVAALLVTAANQSRGPDAESFLAVQFATKPGRAAFRFAEPVMWMDFSPEDARDFAASLLEMARIAEGKAADAGSAPS